MDPKSIWCERQNKPTYVVRDLEKYAPANIIYKALLRRGVFKWLAVRRELITLKNIWKERLKTADAEWREARHQRRAYLKGYRAALRECRAEVRGLCHSQRWRAPDFDREANRWLDQQSTEQPPEIKKAA